MADKTQLKDLLKKLRDAALVGSQEMPSIEELASAAAALSIDEGIAAIEEVFEPIDKLIMLTTGAAQEVNARQYLRERLFSSRPG
jgi:hypothetical protein